MSIVEVTTFRLADGIGDNAFLALDKSVSLGATVVAEPFDVPNGPTLAGILDPEGNPVMLVQA